MNRHLALRLLNRLGVLPFINGKSRITINDVQFEIPFLGIVGVNNVWLSDPWLVSLMTRLGELRDGPFIDVGANIGQTMIKFRSINQQQHYYGFEPNPVCVAYLEKLIQANKLSNCELIPSGLAAKPSILPLYCRSDIDSAASLVSGFRDRSEYSSQKYVVVQCLDEIAQSIGISDVSIIKVDVEGAELDVLEGATKMLVQFRPFIICEILPIYDEHSEKGRFRKDRQVQLEQMLRELDYGLGRIDHATGTASELETIETHADLERCDYLLFPIETRPVLLNSVVRAK